MKDGAGDASAYDGEWSVEVPQLSALQDDHALVVKSAAKLHAISHRLSRKISFGEPELVIQYEVRFQESHECGGAYVKLYSASDYLDLVDNSYERYVDQKLIDSGSLLKDLNPAINPPEEIEDETDEKPDDWDDRPKIRDPDAQKPADWDELAPPKIPDESAVKPIGWLDDEHDMIPDLTVVQPSDWDPENDGVWSAPLVKNPMCKDAPGCGEWTRPMIDNPNYKGKWQPPLIPNPSYSGKWKPRLIPNPNFFEDLQPYHTLTPVAAVGLELWVITPGIAFDNFLIVNSKRAADQFAAETWVIKNRAELAMDPKSQSVVDAVRSSFQENPWTVVFIGFMCTLPIMLCCVYFCRSSSVSRKQKIDSPTDPDREDENTSKLYPEAVKESPSSRDDGETTCDADGDSAVKQRKMPSELSGGESDGVSSDEGEPPHTPTTRSRQRKS